MHVALPFFTQICSSSDLIHIKVQYHIFLMIYDFKRYPVTDIAILGYNYIIIFEICNKNIRPF